MSKRETEIDIGDEATQVTAPATIFDVAAYILAQTGPIKQGRLQRYFYLAQARSLYTYGAPLFREVLYMTTHGPWVYETEDRFRVDLEARITDVDSGLVNLERLNLLQRAIIDTVLEAHAACSMADINSLIHRDDIRIGIVAPDDLVRAFRQREISNEGAFALEVLRLANEGRLESALGWCTTAESVPVHFSIIACNFGRPELDVEPLTREHLPILRQAIADVRSTIGVSNTAAAVLYIARIRTERPLYYPTDERLWPLFDACGAPSKGAGSASARGMDLDGPLAAADKAQHDQPSTPE